MNKVIARIRELNNAPNDAIKDGIDFEHKKKCNADIIQLLYPITPHITMELAEILHFNTMIFCVGLKVMKIYS